MASNNYYVATFRWSKMVWVISILTTLLLVGTVVATLCVPEVANNKEAFVVMILILPLPFVCFALSPRRLYLIGNTLVIKRWVGSVTILTDDITSVSIADKMNILRSKRVMGNGGYFGYTGHFYSHLYGKFRMFATETTNLYLIRTKRQNFVISCSNEKLIEELKNKIKE